MNKMNSTEFVYTFSEIWNAPDRRICFVLGAGASKTSGIRTGGELAKQWLDEIRTRMIDQPELFKQFVEKEKIDEQNPSSSYPILYTERFKFDKDSGFEFINNEMERAKPGYGYSVLAQMMAVKQHNIVITTNFDNLTEEALYTFTPKRPLICGHESLAAFAKPSVKRPLIVKIHRDRYFNPQSETEEINEMNNLWVEALNNIFSASTPVFIGYGGNDGSMMGYMEEVNVINNLFWCERKGAPVSTRVEDLIEKHHGNLVEIDGFDELMFLLQDRLKLNLLDKEIVSIAQDRAKSYRETFEKISSQQSKSVDRNVQQATERIINKSGEDNWWFWELRARAAKTPDQKENLYKEGLRRFPNSTELNGSYAVFLSEIVNKETEAEKYYKKALELDSKNVITSMNYARFLKDFRKDYNEAEKYYKKALEFDPDYNLINSNYAVFLHEIRKSYDEAEKYYKKALEINPDDAITNMNYAIFLNGIRKKYDEAEKYYKKALEIDPSNVSFYVNYANFLNGIQKKYDDAEKNYNNALILDPENAQANASYAIFLNNIRKDFDEAEKYYEKSLSLDPEDPLTNASYAIFLNNVRKDFDKAEKYYKKALEIDPEDANNIGNYTGFLFSTGKNKNALIYLKKAFENCDNAQLQTELWFYKYAHLDDERENSLRQLHQLICDEKIRSIGFDLQGNVEAAIREGHPNPQLLQEIANIITKDAPADNFCSMKF